MEMLWTQTSQDSTKGVRELIGLRTQSEAEVTESTWVLTQTDKWSNQSRPLCRQSFDLL